ncbi:YaaC family protein [Alkalihalophilus marmarensis]|nr:YaaC family protein [Alkalihalophilus marmarensis]
MIILTHYYKQLDPFYSAAFTRSYLTKSYEETNIEQPKTKSFNTCYTFIYHLKHGQLYTEQAGMAPMELKPMLLFYGLVQFLKAAILTKDPTYPANSQVLAHGVTTRKRKKSGFTFLDDEVKIQRNGLFSHLLDKMFHMKHLDNEKIKMTSLLQQLPEMQTLFRQFNYPKYLEKGKYETSGIRFPSNILDTYHMTANRFTQFIQYQQQPWYKKGDSIVEEKRYISIPFSRKPSTLNGFPFIFDQDNIPHLFKTKESHLRLPEVLVHYLLLYNLSMICRYETEWWGELLHTFDGNDLPFITQYVNYAQHRVPALIVELLKCDSGK